MEIFQNDCRTRELSKLYNAKQIPTHRATSALWEIALGGHPVEQNPFLNPVRIRPRSCIFTRRVHPGSC